MNTPETDTRETDTPEADTPEAGAPEAGAPAVDAELRPVRDLDDLAAALGGRLIRPADPEWDASRAAWQLLADQRPVAVVNAAGRHDVALVVRAAAALGLRVAAQSTGHNAGPLGDLSRTLLLRTGGLRGVDIDAAARTARVEAGVTAGDLASAAADEGLAAVGGFSASVGVIGMLLGGGLGWFARSHGAASASVLELEAVTADGVVRRVERGSELFELILSGADIAVIIAATIRLHRIRDLVAGALFWPVESARQVFRAWSAWKADLPEAVTSVVRMLRFPEAPGVPPMFAGRAFAIVEAAIQASPADADAILEPLRALDPQVDTFGATEPPALAALHMDPPVPMPAMGRSALLDTLPDSVVDALVDAVTEGPARILTSVELRHLGGALARDAASPTAGAQALMYGVAVAASPAAAANPNPEAIAAARAAFESLASAVAPVRSAREIRTFTEAASDPERLFGAELPRLRVAKQYWDATDLIHANHSVLSR